MTSPADQGAKLPPALDAGSIVTLYAPQLEAGRELLAAVWEFRPTDLERPEQYQIVLTHVLGRAITSFRAVLLLCGHGLPTQALMLCRSLYEDTIAAFWACLPQNKEGVLDRVLKQEEHDDLMLDEVGRRFGVSAPESPLTPEERNELDRIFAHGTKSWFGRLGPARKAIEPLWIERGGSADMLEFLDRGLHKAANTRLHNTATGLYQGARGTVAYHGRVFPGYGQTVEVEEADMRRAFVTAAVTFAAIADLVFDELDVTVHQVNEASQALQRAALDLMPSQRKARLGRNDPCWCGSGRKLKACHEL